MAEDGAGRVRLSPDELLFRTTHLVDLSGEIRPAQGHGDGKSDADLLAACTAAAGIAARKLGLFLGPDALTDDEERDRFLAALDTEEDVHLDVAAQARPSTWRGHTVRAMTFLLWDAGRIYAEARSGSAGDRLLEAVLHDLAVS